MSEKPEAKGSFAAALEGATLSATASASLAFRTLADQLSLIVQTVIVPRERTHEGILIESVGIVCKDLMKLYHEDPRIFYKIDDRKWEEIIAASYKDQGFEEVTLTPRSGDGGRDVIAVKRGFGSVRFLDQVKAYGPGRLVDANDVRPQTSVAPSPFEPGSSKAPRNC